MSSFFQIVPYNGMSIDDCACRARNAISRLGWNSREVPGAIYVAVPMSMLSWGEDFAIYFLADGFKVESKSSIPLTLIDWGKNKKNVNLFLSAFYS
jgi:hypothetical protein